MKKNRLVSLLLLLLFSHVEIKAKEYDLDALSNLTSVGYLGFQGNPFTNIDGLSNLTTISNRLVISDNDSLITINGLSNINSDVPFSINISFNDLLSNINGLLGITAAAAVKIYSKDALPNLDGLNNLIFADTLELNNNPSWENISLPHLDRVGGYFRIYSNNRLIEVNLLNFLSINDSIEIKMTEYNNMYKKI